MLPILPRSKLQLKYLELPAPAGVAIISDTHGVGQELVALVSQIYKQYPLIEIISVGDLVDRGPYVGLCVKLMKSIGAYLVIGNHEDKMIRYAMGNNVRLGKGQQISIDQLSADDYKWFYEEGWSFIRIPRYNLAVVHGGFIPGIPLEKQDYKQVIRLREISVDKPHVMTRAPSDKIFAHWSDLWKGPERIVYGHSAWDEVQTTEWTYGIDTGCVYGRKLTAAIFTGDNQQPTFIQVPAKKKYWEEHLSHTDD